MRTPLINVGTIIAIVVTAQIPVHRGELRAMQSKPSQPCRIGATASKTRTEGQKGFRSDVTSTCRFDKAASQSTCTNEYVDSVGTKTKTVSVTTFASVADVIDEVKIIPPLRLASKVETKSSGSVQATT